MNIQQLPAPEHIAVKGQLKNCLPLSKSTFHEPVDAHIMPTPTASWSIESMPWKITKADQTGEVMEFTAHASHTNNIMRKTLLHQKRKSELNSTATLPTKQFISEEKITAHFNGLHISSDYIQHNAGNKTDENEEELPTTSGKCFSNLTYADYQITAKELEEKLRNANRITICEELNKFNDEQKKVSYFPDALLNCIQKPCTALVLWQPTPILNILSKKKINKNDSKTHRENDVTFETFRNYKMPDVDFPPENVDEIDDFFDNNNTCNLDFNNSKPDGMDEDL